MSNTYSKEELKERRRVYDRRYRRKHPEIAKRCYINSKKNRPNHTKEWRSEHPDYVSNWYKTEKGKACIQRGHAKRSAKESEIVNTLTSDEWLDILVQSNFKCAYCGVSFSKDNPPTRDHIIPISVGGDNVKENVVPACRSCNSKKHNIVLKLKQ